MYECVFVYIDWYVFVFLYAKIAYTHSLTHSHMYLHALRSVAYTHLRTHMYI